MNLRSVIQGNAPTVLEERRKEREKLVAQLRAVNSEIATLETLIAVTDESDATD